MPGAYPSAPDADLGGGGTLATAVASAPTSSGAFPFSGLKPTGGVSQTDGTALFTYGTNPPQVISADGIKRTLEGRIEAGQLQTDDVFRWLQQAGFTGGIYGQNGLELGSYQGQTSDGRTVTTDTQGRPSSATASTPPGGGGSAGSVVSIGGGGGGYAGGGGSSGGSSGGSAGRTVPIGQGGDAPAPVSTSTTVTGAGGAAGPTRIDPNVALGLDPSKGGPAGPVGGSSTFRSGTFPGAGSILTGLDKNSTLNDVIMNIVKRQEGNRDAAQGIYGGAYDTATNDPVLQASRSRALDVLANPYSLDDQTVSRMLGQQADLIGQNYARLGQASADRAAASGVGRSGIAQADQDRLGINAVRDLGNAQRSLLVEQATRKPGELQASLASAGNFGQQDVGQRTGIAMRAADNVNGQTSIMGDALLSGLLMGGGQRTNVNLGGQGYDVGPQSRTTYYL